MKIIVEGKIPKKTKRFKCEHCGCEFEADKGEYKRAKRLEYMFGGVEYQTEYQCECPCCQETVSVDN